jgi:hypothetical protein
MPNLSSRHVTRQSRRSAVALACVCLLLPGDCALLAQQAATTPAPAEARKLPPEQLDSLVAPIALYPDPLLAQTLAASTYPLELVQLQQWLAKNPGLKDKALVDAVAKQPWDPSVQSMAAFPEVVKRLGDDVQWTTDLGNAFLSQQADVMDAVQRMRKKAKDKGTLATTEQQKVETKVVEKKEVIIVESASPDVPSYDPVVVYGAPIYPYPSIYYPYYYPGAAFVSFGFGFAMGAFWGGMWGGCGWGSSNINVNVNNNFNRVEHRGGDRGQGGRGPGNAGAGGGSWKHNPQHRGGTPYGDRATANKFGGNARGDSLASRQAGARQQLSRTGASDRISSSGGRGTGASDRSAGGGGRGAAGGSSARSFDRGGSGDRIGSRDLGGSGGRGSSGLGGGASGGFDGGRSRASSSRGSSSFGSRGGGGGGRGGGGRR